MSGFHCLTCGDLSPHTHNIFPWMDGKAWVHVADCCNGRVIPIATLCSEPTVIVERDAAIARAEKAEGMLSACEMAHVVEIGKVAAAERARDEVQAKHDRLRMECVGSLAAAGIYLLCGDEDPCGPGEIRRAVAKLAAARDEVGIQLVAAQAVIARQAKAIGDMRALRRDGVMPDRVARAMDAAIAALDTVPGDALPPTSPAGASGQSTSLRAVAVSHLEALGIDSDNVKGGV